MVKFTALQAIQIFRTALLGVLPAVQLADIPWRRLDAYDEWDDIATVLYNALVIETLRGEFPEELWDDFKIPAYDMLLEDYGPYSWIEVLEHRGTSVCVFHALSTENEPFDQVEYRIVSPNGIPLSSELNTVAFDKAKFNLRLSENFESLLKSHT